MAFHFNPPWRMAAAVLAAAAALPTHAGTVRVYVEGRESIFLAGRYDLSIPALGLPFVLGRHGYVAPDFVKEAHPTGLAVSPRAVVQMLGRASGGIDYYNAPSATLYPPEGETGLISNLGPLGGISGYVGPSGALVGVFLDCDNPGQFRPPATLDFRKPESREFRTLAPALRQVFFIGDGVTGRGTAQRFIAPAGAARLFLGIADGFGFAGAPGAYEDNNGRFQATLRITP